MAMSENQWWAGLEPGDVVACDGILYPLLAVSEDGADLPVFLTSAMTGEELCASSVFVPWSSLEPVEVWRRTITLEEVEALQETRQYPFEENA